MAMGTRVGNRMAYGYGSLVPAAPVIILPVFSTFACIYYTFYIITRISEPATLLEGSKVARARRARAGRGRGYGSRQPSISSMVYIVGVFLWQRKSYYFRKAVINYA